MWLAKLKCYDVKLRKEARILRLYEKKKKQNIGLQNRKKESKKFYEIVESPGKKVTKSNNKII